MLRPFRLYPMHISVMSIFVVYESAKAVASHLGFQINSFQYPTPARTLLPDLLLIESLTMPNLPTWNVPSWSISCEVVAYVLFAGAAVAGLMNRRYFLIWAMGRGSNLPCKRFALRGIFICFD